MNQTRIGLSSIWNHFQSTLFSWLEEDLGELTDKQKQLVEADVCQDSWNLKVTAA
jgi:hypothetical protein